MASRQLPTACAASLVALVAFGACEPSPEDRARAMFPDRSRTLAAERPFRRPAGAPPETGRNVCPKVLEDVASGSAQTLRAVSLVTERRREGTTQRVTRWEQGYYVPTAPAAVGLAAGEEYVIRCDRLAGIGINVPDVIPAPAPRTGDSVLSAR